MSITSVVNDTVTSESVINALKPLPPTISGYSVGGLDDTALDPAGGQTVQINGTGFLAGATITFDGSAVAVVTYVNANQLTFTSPAKSAGTYTIYVVNPDGGTAIFIPGIIYSVLPTWTTSAGTLGSYYETTSISNTVVASGDAPITYSLFSGSLPTGSTLYANGVITGTAPVDSSSTTYSFTIQATDAQLQDSTRSFSLTINVDAVTWVSPANATTYTSAVDSAIANVALSATDAAGYAVSYSANALPAGLTLTGSNIAGTPTVVADSSTLLTATAATTNRTAVRTINWSITVANDIYFEYNTLLIPGASTTFVDDASTNNFAVTINGDTKPNSFNPYTPGYYSNYFTGSSYLTLPSSSALTLGTGDFCIEGWLNVSSNSAVNTFIQTNWAGSGAGSSFAIWHNVSGYANKIYVASWSYNSGAPLMVSTTQLAIGQWYHIAVTRSGTSWNLFINGVSEATASGSYNIGTQLLYIGCYDAGYFFFQGYISNTRVVKGSAVYTANFTPSTTPLTAIANTSLLTCQSNRFLDNSTNNFALTVAGSPQISSFDPFVPNISYSTYGSGYFDGTGDYLTCSGSGAVVRASGSFTIEGWYYPTSASASYRAVYSSGSGYATAGRLYQYGTQLEFYNSGSGSAAVGSIGWTINTWNHFAVTWDGTTTKIYVNGQLSNTNSFAYSGTTDLSVSEATYTALGYVSNFRIVSSVVYTAAFTPPVSPLTAIANTSLLTLQNNQSVNNNVFLDNSTNNFFVTRNGNTTQGTFSPYGGNWSNYFDGTGDYLTTPASSILDVGNTSWTIECWVYMNNTTGTQMIVGYNNLSATDFWDLTVVSGVPTFKRRIGGNSVEVSGGTISSNVFTNVTVVRNGTAVTIYLNGSSVATNANVSMPTSMTDQILGIGANRYSAGYDYYFNGFISNLRMVKGTAVYTSNFTPSTTPLTAITNTVLLTCQSNRLIDNSINNFTITKVGDTSVQRFSPFNPSIVTPTSYSGYFDGNGDYLTAPNNAALAFGSGDFCLEFWIYTTAFGSSDSRPLGNNTSWAANAWSLHSDHGTSNEKYTFWVNNYNSGVPMFTSTSSAVLNTWTHVAITRSGTSWRMFINGVQEGSTVTSSAALDGGSSDDMYIGGSGSAYEYVTGYMSNVRAVKGAAVYTSNFTPSTTPLTAISGTSLLTLQSSTFIDNSTNNFTISAFGNSQPTIQNPFGFTSATTNGYTVSTIGGSGYFDGSGDNLNIPSAGAIGSGSFCFETWIYPTNSSVQQMILANASNGGFFVGMNVNGANKLGIGRTFIAVDNEVSYTWVNNQWYHIIVNRSGTSLQFFVNGVQVGSTGSNSINYSVSGRQIGAETSAGSPFYGYISDTRFVNSSIYTANFMPPTAPITAIANTNLLLNYTSAGIYDAAMMNNLETVGDAKLSTAVNKFGGSSMAFDGTGDYLMAPQYLNFDFGTSDFTIEGWIYINSLPIDDYKQIVSFGTSSSAQRWILFIDTRTSQSAPYLRFLSLNSSNSVIIDVPGAGSSGWSAGTWYHVAVTRSGNTFKLFRNGVQNGSTVTNSNSCPATASTGALYVGSDVGGGFGNWNGYIDDLRITKGYARYTSNFTAPTTAFPIY